jgi:hypothetical protein
MSRRRPTLALILGLSALGALAGPAAAQELAPTDDAGGQRAPAEASGIAAAESHASAAFDAYVRKDYAKAVALYEQALAVAPNAALVLYNIARIYDVGLRSRGLAIDYYHRFIAAPGAPPAYILNARARIAELEVAERAAVNHTLVAGATAFDEPEPRAAGPAALPAQPEAPASALAPLPVASPLSSPPPPPLDQNPWTSRELAALAVGGAGVVSVGVGIGFLLSARAKSDVWKRDCNGNECSTQRAVDAAESASKQVAIGTAGLFAGGALLALGGVLWFVDFSSGTPADSSVATASSWSLAPAVSGSELGAAFSTRF